MEAWRPPPLEIVPPLSLRPLANGAFRVERSVLMAYLDSLGGRAVVD